MVNYYTSFIRSFFVKAAEYNGPLNFQRCFLDRRGFFRYLRDYGRAPVDIDFCESHQESLGYTGDSTPTIAFRYFLELWKDSTIGFYVSIVSDIYIVGWCLSWIPGELVQRFTPSTASQGGSLHEPELAALYLGKSLKQAVDPEKQQCGSYRIYGGKVLPISGCQMTAEEQRTISSNSLLDNISIRSSSNHSSGHDYTASMRATA